MCDEWKCLGEILVAAPRTVLRILWAAKTLQIILKTYLERHETKNKSIFSIHKNS